MATKKTINDAAEVVMNSERDGLVKIRDLSATYVAGLEAVKADLPSALPMDAARIINEILGNISYKVGSELPGIIARYDSVTPPAE